MTLMEEVAEAKKLLTFLDEWVNHGTIGEVPYSAAVVSYQIKQLLAKLTPVNQ